MLTRLGTVKPNRERVKVGDYFAINLGRKYAIGQYLYFHKINGTLVRIADYFVTDLQLFNVVDANNAPDLFPPVFTFLKGAIRDGIWSKVGHSAIIHFSLPDFVSFFSGKHRYGARQWFLERDGETRKLGPQLPEQYRELEVLVIWSLEELTERIKTGVNPYDQAKA